MNNLYYIESKNYESLKIKVDEILKKHKLSHENLIIYDMEETNISSVIMDLDTYDLFNNIKIILCKNCTFLGSSKVEINHDTLVLEKYLNNPNPNNILILSNSSIDGKKNIAKLVKETCEVIDTNIDLVKYIKEKIKGYEIDDSTIKYFLDNTNEDITNICNELDKLMAFKSNDKLITKDDVKKIVISKIDANIYELIDAIISKNKEKSLVLYQNMINYGEDVFKIFVSLANQIRLIYQVKVLKNLDNESICDMLNLKNTKQVMALRYKIDKYTEKELTLYLHKLAIMDEALKTGKSIDKIVFPIFIATL